MIAISSPGLPPPPRPTPPSQVPGLPAGEAMYWSVEMEVRGRVSECVIAWKWR
jgi:hypothetical protein